MADKDQSEQGSRLVRVVDAGAVPDQAPFNRRARAGLRSAVVIGAGAAAVTAAGIAGVDGAIQMATHYSTALETAAPYLGAGAGGAIAAAIPEMFTRLSEYGEHRHDADSGKLRSLLRRVKVRAATAGLGLGGGAVVLEQIHHVAGMGGGAEALGIAAAVSLGAAGTSAVGQRLMGRAERRYNEKAAERQQSEARPSFGGGISY